MCVYRGGCVDTCDFHPSRSRVEPLRPRPRFQRHLQIGGKPGCQEMPDDKSAFDQDQFERMSECSTVRDEATTGGRVRPENVADVSRLSTKSTIKAKPFGRRGWVNEIQFRLEVPKVLLNYMPKISFSFLGCGVTDCALASNPFYMLSVLSYQPMFFLYRKPCVKKPCCLSV